MERKNKENINKDILYINTSKLKEDEITAFQMFAMKKYTLFIAISIAVVFGGLGLGLCFVNTYIGVAILLAGIIGGLFFFPYLSKSQLQKQNREIFDGKDYMNTFEFYDDHMKVINIDNNKENSEEISQEFLYSELYKLVSYKEFVFIYINKNQSFILNKTGMKKGTIAELVDFLKNKKIKYQDKTALGEMKRK